MESTSYLARAHFVARLVSATRRREYPKITLEIPISGDFFTQSSFRLVDSIIGEVIIALLSPIP